MKIEYRKRKWSDTWHWCQDCSKWPTDDYDRQCLPLGQRPSNGELCEECKAKEKKQYCRNKTCY